MPYTASLFSPPWGVLLKQACGLLRLQRIQHCLSGSSLWLTLTRTFAGNVQRPNRSSHKDALIIGLAIVALAADTARRPAASLIRPDSVQKVPDAAGLMQRWLILEPIAANGLTD